MKQRSISHRNRSAGLLGGILGILTLSYVWVWAWPLGCLLGVVVGYHFESILEMALKTVNLDSKTVWRHMHIRRPALHCTLLILARFLNVVLCLALAIGVGMKARQYSHEHGPTVGILLLSLVVSVGGIAFFYVALLHPHSSKDRGYGYFRLKGPGRYFLQEMLHTIHAQFYATMVALFMTVYVVMGLMLFVTVGLPRAFFLAMTATGHWLCFSITLLVTAIAAYYMPVSATTFQIWLMAFTCGACSGIFADLACSFGGEILKRTRLYAWLSVSLEDRMKWYGDASSTLQKKWGLDRPVFSLH